MRRYFAVRFFLWALLWAILPTVESGRAVAQVIVGMDGTFYPNPFTASFVGFDPCTSYRIDVAKTAELYPDVGKALRNLTAAEDMTVSLQLQSDPPPAAERSVFNITSISPSRAGLHDARKVCTSSTPGGYLEGILLDYIPARNGYGNIELLLSRDRHVILVFRRDALPLRIGVQIPGKTLVRVYVDNIVGPDGELSQRILRIEALP